MVLQTRFLALYNLAKSLDCLHYVSESLDSLEARLKEEETEQNEQIEYQKRTGRCAVCGRLLLECICE